MADAFKALRTKSPQGISRSNDNEICTAITALRTLNPGENRRSVTQEDSTARVAPGLDP
jgi:hypothetical protein